MILNYTSLEGLKKTQSVNVKCDRCDQELSKSVSSIISQRLKRNGEDVCKRCAIIEYNKTRPIEVRKKAGEGCRQKHKGKKLEEIVGKDKAIEMKQKFSKANSGQNNNNFNGKYSRGFADRPLFGTFESLYGIEKANKLKSDMSKRRSGSGNPMYGKPAPLRSGNGISGRYKGIYFRSLLELSYMLYLDLKGTKYVSCESINIKFSYKINNKQHFYFPDFYIPEINTYVEVKPSQMLKNKIVLEKAKAVQDSGNNFMFITQKDIIKIKKHELIKFIENGQVVIDKGKESWVNSSH